MKKKIWFNKHVEEVEVLSKTESVTHVDLDGQTDIYMTIFKDARGDIRVVDSATFQLLRALGEFPENAEVSDTFREVQKEMAELHARKNADYGNAFNEIMDAYKSKECAMSYACGRLYEKAKRIMSICASGKARVKDESVEDTVFDIGVYSTMICAWLKSLKAHG